MVNNGVSRGVRFGDSIEGIWGRVACICRGMGSLRIKIRQGCSEKGMQAWLSDMKEDKGN